MRRFRALMVGVAVALAFVIPGCFDHGDPCVELAASAGAVGGSDGDPCEEF